MSAEPATFYRAVWRYGADSLGWGMPTLSKEMAERHAEQHRKDFPEHECWVEAVQDATNPPKDKPPI